LARLIWQSTSHRFDVVNLKDQNVEAEVEFEVMLMGSGMAS